MTQKILAEIYEWHDQDGIIYYGWRVLKDQETIHGCSGYESPNLALEQLANNYIEGKNKNNWNINTLLTRKVK